MDNDDRKKLQEHYKDIVQDFKKDLAKYELGHLDFFSIDFIKPKTNSDDANELFDAIKCKKGEIKIWKIHPVTGKQKEVCVPKWD